MEAGLYIHIPFCKGKCLYCDFPSGYSYSKAAGLSYVDSLILELDLRLNSLPQKPLIRTLYLGGGTPSLLDDRCLQKLFSAIRSSLELDLTETTLEANPEDVTEEKAVLWRKIGVERISLGFQSMEENTLQTLGRRNTPEGNRRAFHFLRNAGFENISVDLIHSVRNENLKKSLSKVLSLFPEHTSVYALSIEEKTLLHQKVKKGLFIPLSDEEYAKSDADIQETLENHRYRRYEVSNYAKSPRFFSRHNLNYWNYGNYLGIGLGASGFIKTGNPFEKAHRWTNTPILKEYLKMTAEGKLPLDLAEEIDVKTAIREYIMLTLRRSQGLTFSEFETEFGFSVRKAVDFKRLDEMDALIEIDSEGFRVRKEKIFVSNAVIKNLWDCIL